VYKKEKKARQGKVKETVEKSNGGTYTKKTSSTKKSYITQIEVTKHIL
jgi:hypothetical protein